MRIIDWLAIFGYGVAAAEVALIAAVLILQMTRD